MTERIGQQLGNYRLIRKLGQGGFAEVYLGEHIYLKTLAAVKVLQMQLATEDIEDFIKEAQTVAGLKHPHIVRVLDFGVDKNTPFMVMDYATMGSLRQRHPRGTRLPLTTIRSYVKQIADALQYTHKKELIHRDIKPQNMLLESENNLLLSDFGIAIISQSNRSRNIQDIIGTALYMAPEQIQGKPRRASDQYALGAIVYEWLCGTPPFQGTFHELYSQHLTTPPPSLRQKIPFLPSDVEQVVLTALAKDPLQRFASISAFANALEQACQLEQQQAKSTTTSSRVSPRPLFKSVSRIIGIDFGTTNSVMAMIADDKAIVIENSEGSRLTPSVVAVTKKDEILVGEAAKRQAITNPENTIFSIKRFMGLKYDDPLVDRERRLVPYRIVRANNGDAWVSVQGKQYSPSEISAMILRKLKADAESYLGEKITQVIISTPSYYKASHRQAIMDAATIAGLEVLKLIIEPTAAAQAYGWDKQKDEKVLVYDLGGGNFDVVLMELGDGVFEVKSINGDTHLGGDDFDQRIINWLANEFSQIHGIDLRQDRMALPRLKEAAEKAKRELTSAMQTEIHLPFITANNSGPKHLEITLSRSKLEQLVEDLIERTYGPVMKALSDARVHSHDIHGVILVGGQTRMPAVQRMVRRIFDRELSRVINADEAVAIGAAIYGGVLSGYVKDVLLLDATPLSLGVETLGGVFTCVIARNTTIPTQKSQVFSTGIDNQPTVDIHILQGEREFAKDNESLAAFRLDGIPLAPRGIPQIEVTFDIDANGIVDVSARDKGTGRKQSITVAGPQSPTKDAGYFPLTIPEPPPPPPSDKDSDKKQEKPDNKKQNKWRKGEKYPQ